MDQKEIVYDQIKEKCSLDKGEIAASAVNGAIGGAVGGSRLGPPGAVGYAVLGGVVAGTQAAVSQMPGISACVKDVRKDFEKSKEALDKAAHQIHKAHQAKEKAAPPPPTQREMIIQYRQQRQQLNLASAGRDHSMMSMLRNRSLA